MIGVLPPTFWRLTAGALMVSVFAADSIPGFNATVSILNLVVLAVVAQGRRAKDIGIAAAACVLLAGLGWVLAHAGAPTPESLLRLAFVVIAILATALLLIHRQQLRDLHRQLEESRRELLTFTDAVPYIMWRGSRDGRLDFLNHRYTEITGHDANTALTEGSWRQWIHPEDLEEYLARRDEAISTGIEMRAQFRLRHSSGEYRWMSLIGRVVTPSEPGVAERWYGGVSDVHDEVTAQRMVRDLMATLEQRVEERTEELLKSQERFSTLWQISNITFAEQDFSEAMVILDQLKAQGVTDLAGYFADHPDVLAQCIAGVRTLRINPATARLLGYDSMEELVAQPTAETSEDIEAVMLKQLELPFYGRDETEGYTVLIGKNGRRVPIFYTVHRLPDGSQLSSLLDLTGQHRAEEVRLAAQEELARANRIATVGAFSASVAHELNQPIASMIMDAQTALRFMVREEADIASASRIVERIVRSADRIAGIVTRIRESISGRERSLTRVNLCQLAHDTAELLQRDIRQSDAALEVSCDAGTPLVSADPVELQQVLVNLILNASEAMADHEGERRIRVKVAHVDDGVTVSVSDTGRGFEPEVLDRLFEPFFTTKPNGVGMGLQICRSAVENLGGELQARNADECGAEFIFTLPVLDQEMAAA
ncbi:ATP-binding protein [Sphingomonas sp. MMS24-J13]|uniref:PAS domain-containing sensor histidine kinase n=1 Tax=Sphingomonas sp. MMS24-J13 TaxID=3238686 RepID=UPI00384B7BF3